MEEKFRLGMEGKISEMNRGDEKVYILSWI